MAEINKKFKSLPLVVIFGRANVGKSTLFNCLVEKHQALISEIPGTTRDSNLGEVSWLGREFSLIDTGGILDMKPLSRRAQPEEAIDLQVQRQALAYLKSADLILFLVDNQAGLLPQDKELAFWLKKNIDQKKIMLVANKVDAPQHRLKTSEFYRLALGEPYPVSAANGSGSGDLLDLMIKKLKFKKVKKTDQAEADSAGLSLPDKPLRACIIGKPNVGKSSLLNSLLGYQRVIVSPVPHTTREPQHTDIVYQDQAIRLIDTAGISKRGTKTYGLEKFGITKSLKALAKSDLALLVLDLSQPLSHQDAKLAEEAISSKKNLILIANKWDLVEARDTKKYTDYLYGELPFARFAPIQFISAKTGEKVQKIFELLLRVGRERKLKLSDSQLEHLLKRVVKIHRPAKGKGLRAPRIRHFKQIAADPPIFEITIGAKEDLHFSYVRFIENRLRETFGFLGTPLTILVTKSHTAHGRRPD